jgi:hypothetical protein
MSRRELPKSLRLLLTIPASGHLSPANSKFGDLPFSDQLKFQQAGGSVLRDHFTLPMNGTKNLLIWA